MQCRDHPVANFGFEVDDDVSAHDEVVRPAQDFVVAEVALRQKDARADALGNGVQLTVPNEVRIAPATGHPVDARFGIGGRTRLFDRRLRQVDAGDANGGDRVGSRVVLDQHRDAVAFFSRGAAGAQYVPRAVRPLGQQFRESRGEEELELRAFAQEVGVMGGDEVDEPVSLLLVSP